MVGGLVEEDSDDEQHTRAVPGGVESTEFQALLARVASPPSANALLPGALVGEYRVEKLLGRGAFGAVYHATHTVIGKQVALKVLGSDFSEDAAMSARFVDEARAVNLIAHPNIVDIFGFGVLPDGRKYCVMELLRGTTLGAHLEKQGALPPPEALDILTQVASGLDAAHATGIVHRDLKPENIYLCRAAEGDPVRVKLLDFGIAQIADGLHQRTGSNMVLGTPAYMSPEQCRGARIDYRSDIYSLGVVAYELLTGTLPFQGNNAFQLTAQHLTAQPPAPSAARPELPESVDDAVLGLLAKDPERRAPSAGAAVAQLSHAFSRGAVSARPAPVRSGPSKPRRWIPALALVVFGFVAALVVLARPKKPEPAVAPVATQATTSAAPSIVPEPTPAPSVTLTVKGEPKSARVLRDGKELARLGEPFQLPRSSAPITLTVKAPGYAEQTLEAVPSADLELTAKLKRPGTGGGKKNPELEY